MNSTNPQGRLLAILASAAFVFGALKILLGDTLLNPSAWTNYHVLTTLTVFGTVSALHLMTDAARAKHIFSAIGFFTLFISGTGLVVYQSVGRQAETTGAAALNVEAVNADIADKRAELKDAKARQRHADRKADDEMTGETCGRRCKDWRQNSKDIGIVVANLEAKITALGPQRPVNAKAERMAEVAALFGADRAQAEAMLTLLEPFLWTLFFEIGSIVSLGFAFRPGNHRPDDQTQRREPATVGNDNSCPPTNGGNRTTVAQINRATVASKARAEADVIRIVARGEQLPNQDALASRWGVHKGTASKWIGDFERRGLITRERDGRNKRVAAA